MHVALINQENMGRLNRLQYRVETPYKNGPVDHLFEDYQKAIKYCDQQANEFGVVQLFNHLYKQGYTSLAYTKQSTRLIKPTPTSQTLSMSQLDLQRLNRVGDK